MGTVTTGGDHDHRAVEPAGRRGPPRRRASRPLGRRSRAPFARIADSPTTLVGFTSTCIASNRPDVIAHMSAAHPPEILGLLGDPLRWQLVVELGRSDRRVGELVQLVEKPQNLVSYHLAELRRAGIVTARRSSADGRDVYYRADLFRCRDLLGEAGLLLHPGLSLAPIPADDVGPRRARPRVLFLCTGNSAR